MKKYFAILSFAAAVAARAALPEPDLIARIHFAGGNAIAADKNYSAFTNEFSSAEALALRKQVADKLAPWLAGWLQAKAGATAGAENLRPLFDDLQSAEWFFDAHTVAGKPSGFFAIKLNPARLQIWRASLKSPSFEIADSRGWLFVLFGDSVGKLGDLKIPAPLNGWLDCDLNWPELGRWSPQVKALDLPETKFSVAASGGQMLCNGKLYSPQNFSIRLDAWQVPTNEIHQTFTSFTAVRGFDAWLAEHDWARAWQTAPPANQLFIWSLAGSPFQTFAAAPVSDTSLALAQLSSQLSPIVARDNETFRFVSLFSFSQTTNSINLTGMPIIAPEIKAKSGMNGNYLYAGGFPNSPRGKPLPPELFQKLAQPNLAYYHWEITGPRYPLLMQYCQLALMLTRHRQLDGESAAFKWAQKTAATLGNTVTEIFQTAPDQMTFTRSAPGGLTAFEFFALASWINAPDFPRCNLDLPPLPDRIQKQRLKRLHEQASPSPAPAH